MTLGSLLFVSQSGGDSPFWEYFKVIKTNCIKPNCFCQAKVDTGSSVSAYVIIALITFLGILLFCFSAKKYKTRVRGCALRYYL